MSRRAKVVGTRLARRATPSDELDYRAILDHLPIAVVVVGTNGLVIANRTASLMLGIVDESVEGRLGASVEMIGEDGKAFNPSDLPARVEAPSHDWQSSEAVELRAVDGVRRWVQVDTRFVRQTIDAVDGLLAVQTFVDVTSARKNERELGELHAIQRAILDGLDEGVVLQDLQLGVIAANAAATEMLGITAGADQFRVQLLRNYTCFEADGAPLDLEETPTRRVLRTGCDQRGRVLEYRHHDGSSTWVEADAYQLQTGLAGAESPVLLTLRNITDAHRSAVRLADSERRQRLIIDNSRDLTVIVDGDGIVQFASPSVMPMLGISPEHAVGTPMSHYLHPDDFQAAIDLVNDDTEQQTVRVSAFHADGSIRWLETLVQRLTVADGPRAGLLLTARDITDRLDAERQLEQERQFLDATLASIHAGIMAVRHDGWIIDVNAAFCEFGQVTVRAGMHVSEVAPYYGLWYYDGQQVAPENRPLAKALAGHTVTDEPLRLVRHDGTVLDTLMSAAPIHTADGQRGGVLTLHDVTALRAAETELRRFASIDILTGLHNRRATLDHLTECVQRDRRSADSLAVLFLDLDGFKAVNDRYGHAAGDELLVAAAGRLQCTLRAEDWIGRYGGDEFVVVVRDTTMDKVHLLAKRIETDIATPFLLDSGVANIGCSVGIAIDQPGHSAQSILAAADAAMYVSKAGRKQSALPH